MVKNKVSIYACGGLGINIVKALPPVLDFGYADTTAFFVDTSISNLRDVEVPPENTYLFEGIDGSGKERSENHVVIAKNVLAILQQCKPEAISIVIHSASGGSGSVIGPSIVSELKKRGNMVVVILVGSTGSRVEIDNSAKTLKTYELIAQKTKTPTVVHYLENGAGIPRSAIDRNASIAIMALLALFSGQNDELDTADVRNWLNHAKLKPQLVSLQFCYSEEGYRASGTVITVATLAKAGTDTNLSPLPAYQTVGFLNRQADIDFIEDKPLHFTISGDLIKTASDRLEQKLSEVEDYLNAVVERESLIKPNDIVTDTGICL